MYFCMTKGAYDALLTVDLPGRGRPCTVEPGTAGSRVPGLQCVYGSSGEKRGAAEWGCAHAYQHRDDRARTQRKDPDHRWSLCRDERATRRLLPDELQRPRRSDCAGRENSCPSLPFHRYSPDFPIQVAHSLSFLYILTTIILS